MTKSLCIDKNKSVPSFAFWQQFILHTGSTAAQYDTRGLHAFTKVLLHHVYQSSSLFAPGTCFRVNMLST